MTDPLSGPASAVQPCSFLSIPFYFLLLFVLSAVVNADMRGKAMPGDASLTRLTYLYLRLPCHTRVSGDSVKVSSHKAQCRSLTLDYSWYKWLLILDYELLTFKKSCVTAKL